LKIADRQLPCGCIRGEFLCSEAEELWAKTEGAYRRAISGRCTWEEYRKAVEEYNRHFATLSVGEKEGETEP